MPIHVNRGLLILLAIAWLAVIPHSIQADDSASTTSGSITGKAVDADGKGVEKADVVVTANQPDAKPLGTATTDSAGEFKIDKIPAQGDLVVTIVHKGKLFTSSGKKSGVKVDADKTTDVGSIELKIQTH